MNKANTYKNLKLVSLFGVLVFSILLIISSKNINFQKYNLFFRIVSTISFILAILFLYLQRKEEDKWIKI